MRLVKDVMTRQVYTIETTATVEDAANRMRMYMVGALPVQEGERLVGMLTDRDIVCRAVAHNRLPASTTVSEVMTPKVVSCVADTPVWKAEQLMEEHVIRRLIVLDGKGGVVGILSYDDLAVLPPADLEPPPEAVSAAGLSS
jgi:CBS domain-containing protein